MVATWSPLARNQSTQAAPMPRVPPVTSTTAISAASGTRSQTSGWPSWTRSPSAASQRITSPGERRAHLGDADAPDEVAHLDGEDASGPSPVPGSRPVPGACSDDSGLKMPLEGLTTTRSDMYRCSPWCRAGSARQVPAAPIWSIRVSRSSGLETESDWISGRLRLARPLSTPPGPSSTRRSAPGRRTSRASGASAPGCRAAPRAVRATRPDRRARGRRRWPPPAPRG